ncbi:DNA-directed RNA polymerase subunit E'' [archaeon]|nr:DNA-directed RNA polymerase subunit E'' [archaeon]
MAKKACKKCKLLVEGNVCPICKGNKFSDSWKGRLFIMDPEKSEIAKRVGLKVKGEYVIKI